MVRPEALAVSHVFDRGFDSSGFSGAQARCRGRGRIASYSLTASPCCTSRTEKIQVAELDCKSSAQLRLRGARRKGSSRSLTQVAGVGARAMLGLGRSSGATGV